MIRAHSLTNWERDLLSSIKLEKLRFSLRGSLAQFYAIWKPILMILELEFATIGNSQSNVSQASPSFLSFVPFPDVCLCFMLAQLGLCCGLDQVVFCVSVYVCVMLDRGNIKKWKKGGTSHPADRIWAVAFFHKLCHGQWPRSLRSGLFDI